MEFMNQRIGGLLQQIDIYAQQDICLAFSGGVDSSLLLKLTVDAAARSGKHVYALTFHTRLHPPCDMEIAEAVAKELGGLHYVLQVNELEQESILSNPPNRCYLCKKYLFAELKEFAAKRHISLCMDGTNEDDMHEYRPGIQALRELDIISPLADYHITKEEVKAMAAYYGISVAARPSTPCMATRLPYGAFLDKQVLERIAAGEAFLGKAVGGNIRIRLHGAVARIEADSGRMRVFLENKDNIVAQLKQLGFEYITLDLEGFRSGSMDIHIQQG